MKMFVLTSIYSIIFRILHFNNYFA